MRKSAYAFLEKLTDDDSIPGLHIEPIMNAADPRVRTGRVDSFYRAVLFKVQGQGQDAHYIYLGVWPHDDAIKVAKQTSLSVNPVNGIAELITSEPVPAPSAPAPVPAESRITPVVAPILVERGFDAQALVDELGIDQSIAEQALAATSQDELMEIAERAVEWQGLALLGLAEGDGLSDVKEALGIGEAAPAELSVGADDRLLWALQHPAARLQFAFIEDDDELRRAIEDNDFDAWRVFLHPEQRKYATTSYRGAFRLSGGAGTGKTVVLLHRARHLAQGCRHARVMLTTYTRTLADALRTDLRRLDPSLPVASELGDSGIYVTGVDAAVSAVLKAAGDDVAEAVATVLGPRSTTISRRTASEAWQEAIDASGPELPDDLRSPTFFIAEYAMVVLPQQIVSPDDYLRARRQGRGVALDRARRQAVWNVVSAYRARASINGSIDFTEAAAVAAAWLKLRGPRVDHALIDEGQDLSPSHWQFLRALTTPGEDDLFIAEDSHQRIYGQRVVLGRYGIPIVGRSRRLTLNYRTTFENLRLAVGVLSGADYVDLEEEPESSATYRSARSGPEPRLISAGSLVDELESAANIVREWLGEVDKPETLGILVRDAQLASQVVRGMEERGVRVRLVDGPRIPAGQPVVMTMHRAKGMEFSRVLLFDVNDAHAPARYVLKNASDAERSEILLRERSLLYVAATRARDELVIMWSGSRSELLPG
ncbi:3'-5' exonuclease [Kribbella sp. HUAS MG21]|uniref:DNA 3'-5' helicase n=1 Tax=Kribbella sp. HUAS MG21 TaxID=3160966 RepID=A0AAU7TI69_9ACTN